MISVEEMRTLLSEQYGIRSDEDLDRELKKQGGIRIALFVDTKEKTGRKKCETAKAG